MRALGDETMANGGLDDLVGQIFDRPLPYLDALGLVLVELFDKGLVLRMPYAPHLVGNPDDGVLHGGAIGGLIDTACGFAAMRALSKAVPVATVDLRIDYLRPAAAGADLLARAECYRLTRRIAFCRATAFNEVSKDPVAEALGTFMIPEQAAPGDKA